MPERLTTSLRLFSEMSRARALLLIEHPMVYFQRGVLARLAIAAKLPMLSRAKT